MGWKKVVSTPSAVNCAVNNFFCSLLQLNEGRGKMKKMMSMMMAGFMMKLMSMVPIAIAGLYVLAGKALVRIVKLTTCD